MKNFNIEQLIVGELDTNCWIYPLDTETEAAPELGAPMKTDGKAAPQNDRTTHSGYCALIDPGENARMIIAQLERLNLYPRYILLTHGHFDHIAALPALFDHYGAGLEIAIHNNDRIYLGPDAWDVHWRSYFRGIENIDYIKKQWQILPSPTRILSEGESIGPFTVLHLPGHSPGSAGFYDRKKNVLFSGDTLFYHNIGRSDLLGGDPLALEKSLRRLLGMDEDIAVFPGHGQITSIGEECNFYQIDR
ncbi:MAG: MBL fold metallo-hydrolase [Treponema sp.]|jgi:glyoxylase-like metal-dependent hydrolase (beta-lactamase superfamily II)|nr:MBL fold metallo-hydrolase [Treponema sp.]